MTAHRTAWLWRAWDAGKTRICDCGIVYAETADKAETYARMCVGGPWISQIASVVVEKVECST